MWLDCDVATPFGQVALHGPATVAPPLCNLHWLDYSEFEEGTNMA